MDVPAVAVTMNTNDFGSVKTLAKLAQVTPAKAAMSADATDATGNLVSGADYMHGVCIADFAVTCGNLTGVTLWAPVQEECDLGTLADNIDQTLFLDEVYVNSLEFSYTTGANATENYGAETDNKMWLLNDGKFVSYLEATVSGGDVSNGYLDLVDDLEFDITTTIPTLSTGNTALLRKSTDGAPAVTFYDDTANTMTNVETVRGNAAVETTFVLETTLAPGTGAHNRLYFPTNLTTVTVAEDDIIQIVIAGDKYATTTNTYFEALDGNTGPTVPYEVGALRQGQVEVYIVNPIYGASYENAWRLTGVTISADLTREPLTELGHLGPYDRPLTLPVPITVTVDSTAGDLENWAKLAGLKEGFDDDSLDDIDLTDLMTKDDLCLVVKVFEQTDEEAGGTGSGRHINTPGMHGKSWFVNGDLNTDAGIGGGQLGIYEDGDIEYALKTIIVKNLKITDEGMTLDVGANATQTFGFRANNDLFVVKGDVDFDEVVGMARNSTIV